MRKIGFIALVLAAMLASADKAEAQRSMVQMQLDTVFTTLAGQGYKRDVSNYGSQIIGAMDDDGAVMIQVTLRAGTQYIIAGGCDSDCSDMDLAVTTGSTVVASDVLTDDVPMVKFTAPNTGAYMVKITMVACSANPCAFGLAVATK